MYIPEYMQAFKEKRVLELIIENYLYKTKYNNSIHKSIYDEIKRTKAQIRISDKVRKEVYNTIDFKQIESNVSNLQHVHNETVWFLWFQGIEEAPELIQLCYKSIKYYMCDELGWKLNVVSKDNLKDYVEIPDFIMKKVDNGEISFTHFSDIIRIELLIKHGGLWIDSTVLMTGNHFIKNLEKIDLFAPSKWIWFDSQLFSHDSWLIYATSNNINLIKIRECLYTYWKNNNILIEYFLFHVFWEMVIKQDERALKKMPYLCVHACEMLQTKWDDDFDKGAFDSIISQTNFHKLSYKRIKNSHKGSIGEYLKNQYLIQECHRRS